MEIIRYGVSRDDLHNLLRMIGVLQPSERVISVSDVDLHASGGDLVIVTVSTASLRQPEERSILTDKELQQRLAELHAMRDASAEELRKIQAELESLNGELKRRQIDERIADDGIPEIVAMNIGSQIRSILSSGKPGSR